MLPFLRLLPGLLLIAGNVIAQSNSFTPLGSAETGPLKAAIEARYHRDIASLSGPYKKDIATIYNERYTLIAGRLAAGELLCNTETQQYLNALAHIIFKANPSLAEPDVRLLFSRSFQANAASMGEGTILFNIGLFHRLQNEAQAAFVLCHELAHYFLNHSNNNIAQYVATTSSGEFQKSLKQIQQSDYRQNSQLETLSKNLLFRSRRHNRAYEQAADSMALELMKNTGYDVAEALTCLQLLNGADEDKYNNDLALNIRFDFDAFPFKKRWLQHDELRFATTDDVKIKAENDSLKTHPDCAKRIERLSGRMQQYRRADSKKFLVSEQLFQTLILQFDFEIIEYCYQQKQWSRALYFALQLLAQHPDNAYLHAMTGHCLNGFYTAQKAHELGTVTELPGDAFGEKYNGLLRLIQNLRLQEIAALSYYFLKESETGFAADERFVKALIQSKAQFGQPEEEARWTNYYNQTFSKAHVGN